MKPITSKHPFNLYYNGGDYVKICGSQDGYFPDFGHHVPNENGRDLALSHQAFGRVLVKVTDSKRNITVWARSDEYESHPWGSVFRYDHGLGHIPVSIERTQFASSIKKKEWRFHTGFTTMEQKRFV